MARTITVLFYRHFQHMQEHCFHLSNGIFFSDRVTFLWEKTNHPNFGGLSKSQLPMPYISALLTTGTIKPYITSQKTTLRSHFMPTALVVLFTSNGSVSLLFGKCTTEISLNVTILPSSSYLERILVLKLS